MVKKVRCKKCRLEYDKKKYECPYCHKKRFNPTGLIIFLIIIAIAGGITYYFLGDKIQNYFTEKAKLTETETNDNGLIFKNFSIERNNNKDNEYTIKFDIENKTESSIDKNYLLVNLADKVKASVINGEYFIIERDYCGIELHLMKDEIFKAEYNVRIDNDWQNLEIYLREIQPNSEEIKDLLIFSAENNLKETEKAEETDINIITEN